MFSLKEKALKLIAELKSLVNITEGSDKENTVKSIISNIPLKGDSIWYLVCSSLLASIGLDVNSPAIIIGAMLISPLMSPILGIGLSIGIHDRENIFLSVRVFVVSVAVSLLISTLYFLISPLSQVTSEILARTTPTLLDVGVAFFGGVAGIVAGSRSKGATAIPGVAIATALMPPVCTAGFGLATGNGKIFFGAIYLFFINAVFISLSAYLIVRYLKFPYKEYPTDAANRRMKRIVLTVITVVTIPSIIIFYSIVKEASLKKMVGSFISKNISVDSRNVIKWDYLHEPGDSIKVNVFVVGGSKVVKTEVDSLNSILENRTGYFAKLNITQLESASKLQLEQSTLLELKLQELQQSINSKIENVDSLETIIASARQDSVLKSSIKADSRIMLPEIESIELKTSSDTLKTGDVPGPVVYETVFLQWKAGTGRRIRQTGEEKLTALIKSKLPRDSVIFKEVR